MTESHELTQNEIKIVRRILLFMFALYFFIQIIFSFVYIRVLKDINMNLFYSFSHMAIRDVSLDVNKNFTHY